MVEIKNLKKIYGDRVVLSIPDMKIEKGERIILVGHNGSGKSTLLKILAGVITDFDGEVKVNGEAYYLPQQNAPFDMSVRKNISYCLKSDKKEKKVRCDEVLKLLELDRFENKNARLLSGGETQRLCFARVIANRGDILLLDEPTSAADEKSTLLIERAIEAYQKETACTLVMTTHSKGQAERLGGRKIVLCDGERVSDDA